MATGMTDALRYAHLPTPIGAFTVVCSTRGVLATQFSEDGEDPEAAVAVLEHRLAVPLRPGPRALRSVANDVRDYFAGRAREFTTQVDLSRVPQGFGRRVLETTLTIPFGELWTYGDVAEQAGSPRAGRAVGSALARCPIELFVPCHRVVHTGGAIRGYGRHDDRKRWLVKHELMW
jgi:methylated-DNA-[protein]-cysteine S-methyltransferase